MPHVIATTLKAASSLGITMWDIRTPHKPAKEYRFPDSDNIRYARPSTVHTAPGVLIAHAGMTCYIWSRAGTAVGAIADRFGRMVNPCAGGGTDRATKVETGEVKVWRT
jgi:hypothetical protein